jgi:hypothetical protein
MLKKKIANQLDLTVHLILIFHTGIQYKCYVSDRSIESRPAFHKAGT